MTTEGTEGEPDAAGRADPGAAAKPKPPNRWERRLGRIRAEIERNRAGDPAIPTWVLALVLVLLIGGVALVAVLS
jgi:hypothetical protein